MASQGGVMALPEGSTSQVLKQQELMQELEVRRRMKSIHVPTDDGEVRKLLREMGEPITRFGERELERSERLKRLYALADFEGSVTAVTDHVERDLEPLPTSKELFYTEGTEGLKRIRMQIANKSLIQAARRIDRQRRLREEGGSNQDVAPSLRHLANQVSEIGDDRPIMGCAFSPDGQQILTGAWSGTMKVWDAERCTILHSFGAHNERITGIAWHPHASTLIDDQAGTVSYLSGAADGQACLWSSNGQCLRKLEGHTDRLGRVAFHPFGELAATTSFDLTWRLWDVESGACVLEQEGHSRAVYAIAFQGDGALAASGGMDAIGRLWDLRTGRNILKLEGHVKPILALDFSPNGYQLVTGSEDNTAHIFDLRKKGTLAILPGHTSLISQVRFEPAAGSYLLTCGYDRVSKVWNGKTFGLEKTLMGHESKVMAGDISPSQTCLIATTGYDRTLKLYAPEPFDDVDHDGMML